MFDKVQVNTALYFCSFPSVCGIRVVAHMLLPRRMQNKSICQHNLFRNELNEFLNHLHELQSGQRHTQNRFRQRFSSQ